MNHLPDDTCTISQPSTRILLLADHEHLSIACAYINIAVPLIPIQ